jgi:hypothetical protein
MKRFTFAALFVSAQLSFVFFLVYKSSLIVHLHHERHQLEHTKEELIKRKDIVAQQLLKATDRTTIARLAQEILGLEKVKPTQLQSMRSE